MLRFFISLFFLIAIPLILFYIMPVNLKTKTIALISSIIPLGVREEIEPLIYTPIERRAKLLDKLETNSIELKNTISEENPEITKQEILNIINENDEIIKNLKKTNQEQGPLNKITTTIIEKTKEIFVPEEKKEKENTNQNQSNENKNCLCQSWQCD